MLRDGMDLSGHITITQQSGGESVRQFVASKYLDNAQSAAKVDRQGMWWNPAESGWGINVVQQADLAFITWFVFGQDGMPTWFVSAMRGTSGTSFAGDLYTGTGAPYDASSFSMDPALLVGTATITLSDAQHANLQYTVKGIPISKPLETFTFSAIAANGVYEGGNEDYVVGIGGNGISVTTMMRDLFVSNASTKERSSKLGINMRCIGDLSAARTSRKAVGLRAT